MLNFFVPKSCCICGKLSSCDYICTECAENIEEINQNNCCKICGYPFPEFEKTGNFLDKRANFICPSCNAEKRYFNKAKSVFQYKGNVRKMLMNLKFYFQIDSLQFIGDKMLEVYMQMPKTDYICFVPITKFKLFCKGYNHAGLIANSFMKALKKHKQNIDNNEILLHDFIVKNKNSQSSKELSQAERWMKKYNFSINEKYNKPEFIDKFNGKKFLVIDDIMTTGATLNATSKIIKDNFKNSNVYCLTFARTMLY